MESKITIDIDIHRQEHINLRWSPTDDVRDKLLAMFLQTSVPGGYGEGNGPTVLDGYCRLSVIGRNMDSGLTAEIIPIHPIDMPKHIKLIEENADKFKTVGDQE